jgi:DNA-binding transcriptional MerR regulator
MAFQQLNLFGEVLAAAKPVKEKVKKAAEQAPEQQAATTVIVEPVVETIQEAAQEPVVFSDGKITVKIKAKPKEQLLAKPAIIEKVQDEQPAKEDLLKEVIVVTEQTASVVKEEASVKVEKKESVTKISIATKPVVVEKIKEDLSANVLEETPVLFEANNIVAEEIKIIPATEKIEEQKAVAETFVVEENKNVETQQKKPAGKLFEEIAVDTAKTASIKEVKTIAVFERTEEKSATAKPTNIAPIKSKRGRKSYKEIDATIDLVEVPDDETLNKKLYYTISEVAGWFKVNNSQIRFWENEFDILKPRKNRKGDRLFRLEDIQNLKVIYYLLRNRKFSIEGAKKYLKANKHKADITVELTQSLNRFRSFLLELKAGLGN